MDRRRLIIVLLGLLVALQAAMLTGRLISLNSPLTTTDVATSSFALAATIIIYIAGTHFYFAAIRRSAQAHAARGNAELERMFELYRTRAQREEHLTRRVCQAIESELGQARDDLADGRIEQTDSHLQHCLDITTDALPERCHNVTAAAVFEAESRQCANEGVKLITMADIPATIGLPDIDVAAILFSMIDGALEECKAQLAENPLSKPTITARAITEKDELVIEVEHTQQASDSAVRRKAKGTRSQSRDEYDWNSKVVGNLVKEHRGLVESVEEGGLARTTIMIPLQHAEPAGN